MEVNNNNLQALIERAWVLQDEISDEINVKRISFCRFCLENGQCCGVAETSLENERLIAIRDSLNDIENKLVILQRLKSWQQTDRNSAITWLEESRLILMEKVGKYDGRELDVMEELNSYFGDLKTAQNWNLKRLMEKMTDPTTKKGSCQFSLHCIWSFLNPWNWNWRNTATVAIKLVLVSASISSTFNLCRNRLECDDSQRKMLSFVDLAMGKKNDFPLIDSKCPLDAFHGRG